MTLSARGEVLQGGTKPQHSARTACLSGLEAACSHTLSSALPPAWPICGGWHLSLVPLGVELVGCGARLDITSHLVQVVGVNEDAPADAIRAQAPALHQSRNRPRRDLQAVGSLPEREPRTSAVHGVVSRERFLDTRVYESLQCRGEILGEEAAEVGHESSAAGGSVRSMDERCPSCGVQLDEHERGRPVCRGCDEQLEREIVAFLDFTRICREQVTVSPPRPRS
jgi:hypothetical protein